jgi:hypothetical protein
VAATPRSVTPPEGDAQTWALVRAVAARGLVGSPVLPDGPRHRDGWHRLQARAEDQRVLGLLAGAVADGVLDPDPASRSDLGQLHEAWCAHDLRLERALGLAADALDRAGVPFLVTKGPALAHRAYPDPAQRLFADLDLIVPSGRVHAATDLLVAALGASVIQSEVRPGFDERFGKETLLRTPATATAPRGLEIDVHRTPVAGALGLAIDLDELFDQAEGFDLGGRRLPTPGRAASVLLAAYQASVADIPPRLGARRDLAQLLATSEVDPTSVIDLAIRWRADTMLAAAVNDTWTTLGLAPPADHAELARGLVDWARGHRGGPVDRLVLAAHRRSGYVYWRQLAGVIMVPGLSARRDYLLALTWPQADYLADRQWSWRGHLRRALRSLSAPVRLRVVATARRVRGVVDRRG